MMISILICTLISFIQLSKSCDDPWCYTDAYMTVCHDRVECGLVNDINTGEKCTWYENGVAVRPGMFETKCNECKDGTYQKCVFSLEDDGRDHDNYVDAEICEGNEEQTCFVECGAEICIKYRDDDTGKEFYKTGRTVSSCPQNHPVNNNQCCEFRNWEYCTCLQRPTVDVSDDVYDDLGQSNNFVDVWFGSCGDSEYHATDDTSIKLVNEDGISEWYYAVAARTYNPNWEVNTLKAKSANADSYYECQRSGDVFKCFSLKDAAGPMEGPISLEMYTSYTDDGGYTYRSLIKENIMSLEENEVVLVDLYDSSSFTEDDEGNASGLTMAEIILVIIAVLIVVGVVGVIGYCVYKRRQNKGDVSFEHESGIDNTKGIDIVEEPQTNETKTANDDGDE